MLSDGSSYLADTCTASIALPLERCLCAVLYICYRWICVLTGGAWRCASGKFCSFYLALVTDNSYSDLIYLMTLFIFIAAVAND